MSEVVISQQEYQQRRSRLLKQLKPGDVMIIPTARELKRNADAEFPFRPNSDFYYLTGFKEPEAILVLIKSAAKSAKTLEKKPSASNTEFQHREQILFCRPKNRDMEIWTGKRMGPAAAKKQLAMDASFEFSRFQSMLPKLLANSKRLFIAQGQDCVLDAWVAAALEKVRTQARAGIACPQEIHNPEPLIHEMRLIKSTAEIAVMQKAADISAAAHIRAMKRASPGVFEYQLEAELAYGFLDAGSRALAYNSIVGSGPNACILHYNDNSRKTRNGDLVLIDAGCELDCYASDITRTFPVNGKFNPQQKALYDLVLKAQLAAIDAIKPGVSWNHAHEVTVQVITRGLIKLGLLQGKPAALIKNEAYREFYMHRAGHWLGMDVHDVGDYKIDGDWRPLKAGMVLTVEPGIYVAPDNKQVDKAWRGIGIRIEDDVLVTRQGCRVLSSGVPKTVADIEALMAEH